jgi:hypothetical protein
LPSPQLFIYNHTAMNTSLYKVEPPSVVQSATVPAQAGSEFNTPRSENNTNFRSTVS